MKESEIITVYDAVKTATEALFHAYEDALEAEMQYQDARGVILTTIPSKELGANEETRSAAIDIKLAELVKQLHNRQAWERAAKHAYDLARIAERELNMLSQAINTGAATETDDGIPF